MIATPLVTPRHIFPSLDQQLTLTELNAIYSVTSNNLFFNRVSLKAIIGQRTSFITSDAELLWSYCNFDTMLVKELLAVSK